jgi:large repetitive protein
VVDASGKKRDCDGATVTVAKPDPVPVDDPNATTKQATAVPILVTSNDTSPDPERLRVWRDPEHGTAVVKQPRDGTIDYTPEDGFSGEDSFEYDYCEGVVGPNVAAPDACPRATVTVAVEPVPEAVDDPDARTERDRPVDIDVMKNDNHPVASQLQVLPQPAPEGTAGVQRNGIVRYTPKPGATGRDSFAYDYCRSVVNLTAGAGCDSAIVTVDVRPPPEIRTVTPNPTPPNREVVVKGSTGVCQEGGLKLGIPPPGEDVEVAVTAEQDGTFESALAVPGGTFVDSYPLELRVDCDGRERVAPASLEVRNEPPDAVDDQAETAKGSSVTIPVTDNDTDPDGDDGYQTALEAAQPANGATEVLSGGRIRYTPDKEFSGGKDPFTYSLCELVDANGRRDCDAATVTVTVIGDQDPVPVDDRDVSTPRDQPVVIDVMWNDRDPDAALLRVKPPARPGARAEEQPDGTVLYTPEAGFTGIDTFQYDYCDGSVDVTAAAGPCPPATVTVDVTAGPVISLVEPGSTPPGRAVQVAGNTGTCTRAGILALQGTGATVTVTGDQDGAFTTSLTVPGGTFPRPYRLELRANCQGRLQRAEAELAVTNQTPEAADDARSTTRNQAVRIPVLDNDRDPDDPDGYRALVLVTGQPDRGTAEEQPDLTVVYTPEPGFIGEDRFTYSLCDDVLDAAGRANCGAATVTVAVTDVPVISSVEPAATSPGRPVKVVGNTGSCDRAGTLTFHGESGRRMDVAGDRNGVFTAGFSVPERAFPGARRLELVVDCGGQLQRAQAELMVTNRAPVAADDRAKTTPDTSTAIDVTGNDRDPDDPDTYPTLLLVTDPPGRGTAEVRPDLSVVYTPEPGFVGEDRFVYSLCDDLLNAAGQADCGTATVTVRVDPTGCAPTAGQDPRLRVEPGRGRGGTRLRITAAVDPRLATCQFRLLLGGAPLGPDVSVENDGSISADRGVPDDARPGPRPVRLATLTAETLDEIPFEVVDGSSAASWLFRLLLSAGLVLAGFLARAAFKRLRKPGERPAQRRGADLPGDLRARPHTGPVESAVVPVNDSTRTSDVRLEPHFDRGVQAVETVEEVTR